MCQTKLLAEYPRLTQCIADTIYSSLQMQQEGNEMKRRSLITISLFMTLSLILAVIPSYAENDHKVIPETYDPSTMTIEERWAWVQENVEPIYVGPAHHEDRSEILYTNLDTSYVGPNDYTNYAKVETKVKFTVNDTMTRVQSWSTDTFRATPLIGTLTITDTNSSSTRLSDDNVRIIYEAWFANITGAYYIEHWYNVYSDGGYALYVNKGGPL